MLYEYKSDISNQDSLIGVFLFNVVFDVITAVASIGALRGAARKAVESQMFRVVPLEVFFHPKKLAAVLNQRAEKAFKWPRVVAFCLFCRDCLDRVARVDNLTSVFFSHESE